MSMRKAAQLVCCLVLGCLPLHPGAAEQDSGGQWALLLALQGDNEDARAVQAGLSYALSAASWVSLDAGVTRQATPPGEATLRSRALGLGLDHNFGRMGLQLSADYWGDPGELVRTGIRGSVYHRGEFARLDLLGIYRDYELTARIPDDEGNLLDERELGMHSTGLGFGARFYGDSWFGGLRGAWFDFSRDPKVFRSRTAFRVLSLSALTLANSFLDYRAEASLGFEWGLRSLEFELSAGRSAVDDARVRTVTLYYVTPLSERLDLEVSLGRNDSEGLDNAVFAGLALSWFGR